MDTFGELLDAVRTVMDGETPSLLDNKSVAEFVTAAAEKIRRNPKTELPMRVAVAKTLVETKIESAKDACALITNGGMNSRRVTVETCMDALAALKSFGDADATKQWADAIEKRFPDALNSN
jgi:hypothetical protein